MEGAEWGWESRGRVGKKRCQRGKVSVVKGAEDGEKNMGELVKRERRKRRKRPGIKAWDKVVRMWRKKNA